jgi:hypothetical protein
VTSTPSCRAGTAEALVSAEEEDRQERLVRMAARAQAHEAMDILIYCWIGCY